MVYQMVSPGTKAWLIRSTSRIFDHTYTLVPQVIADDDPGTPTVDEGLDPYGQPIYENPGDLPGRPCHYIDRNNPGTTNQMDIGGLSNVNYPELIIPGDDTTIQVGDHVKDIGVVQTTPDGVVSTLILVAGPVQIEDLRIGDPSPDGTLYLRARLRTVGEIVP